MEDLNLFYHEAAIYKNWYVLHVDHHKTDYFVSFIKRKLGNDYPIISFSRELLHYKDKRYLVIEKPLFPGYLFVHKHPEKVLHLIKDNFKEVYANIIRFEREPAEVNAHEMRLLLTLSNHTGKVGISKAYKEGEGIVITSGPLSNLKGEIRFIDKKKRKINVSFPLLNTMMNVSLSYDLL